MTRHAALNRFGLGARIGEPERMADPRAWLLAQLDGPPPARPVPDGAGRNDIAAAFAALRRATRAEDAAARAEARRAIIQIGVREGSSTLALRAASDRPFVERLIAFWADHLCVSIAGKAAVAPLAGSYERDVIRRHALGSFSDMVLASAQHPAMLSYLDNVQSTGPRSAAGQRARRGLNENYARELLELHTLGVNGGYSQADVTELARLLTGWTFEGAGGERAVAFRFVRARHEPGRKTVLGQRYGDGEAEGVRAIRALCAHPSTAQHVATKLARHFVADEPPTAIVTALAVTFRETEGDLREMARTLVGHPDAWREDARKFRTPQDWVVAVLRATDVNMREAAAPTGAGPARGIAALDVLRQLRQPLWSPSSPKGFGDLERDWADPDALLNRAELARTIARRVQVNPRAVERLASLVPEDEGLREMLGQPGIAVPERAALVLAGPSFQWR